MFLYVLIFSGTFFLIGNGVFIGRSMQYYYFTALNAGSYLCWVAMVLSFIHCGLANSAKKTFTGSNQVVAVPGQITVVSQPGPGYPGQPGQGYPGQPGQGHPGQQGLQAYSGQPTYPGKVNVPLHSGLTSR